MKKNLVWKLFPSHVGAAEAARKKHWEQKCTLGSTHFSFSGLAREIIKQFGQLKPVTNSTDRTLLMMKLLTPHFNLWGMRDKWAVSKAYLNILDELKANLIFPSKLLETAQILEPTLKQKVEETALIFEAYTAEIKTTGFRDPIDELLDAAQFIKASSFPTPPLEIQVKNFFKFSPIQLHLLNILSNFTSVNFYSAPGLIHGCLRLHQLKKDAQSHIDPLTKTQPSFTSKISKILPLLAGPPQVGLPHSITLRRYPSRESEARQAAKAVKELILSGVSPQEIIIIYKELSRALELERNFHEIGIPIWLDTPVSATNNSLLQVVELILTIAIEEFPRAQVIELAAHPACTFILNNDTELWQHIDKSSRKAHLLGGLTSWERLLNNGLNMSHLLELLKTIQNSLCNTNVNLAESLVKLLETIKIPQSLACEEDIADSWAVIKKSLLRLNNYTETTISLLDLREFVRVLANERSLMREPLQLNRVVAVNAFNAVGISRQQIFLIGMSEDEFSGNTIWNSIFTSCERAAINNAANAAILPTIELLKEEDEACFLSLLYQPQEVNAQSFLHLSYAASLEKGSTLPSYLIEEFIPKEKVIVKTPLSPRKNLFPDADNIYTRRELLVWLGSYNFSQKEYWDLLELYSTEGVIRGQQMELARMDCKIEALGKISEKYILEKLEQLGDMAAPIPVTQIEEYGKCPFRFFAQHILKLKELEEPEADVTPLDAGRLAHEVLAEVYSSIKKENGTFASVTEIQIKVKNKAALLLEKHKNSLVDSPILFDLFKKRFLLVLEEFVGWDLRQMQEEERIPMLFELSFTGKQIKFKEKTFYLSGRCDRIDERDGKRFIIDYKWGKGKTFPAHDLLQVPLYALILQEDKEIAGGGYFSITQPLTSEIRRDPSWKGRQRLSFEDTTNKSLLWLKNYFNAIHKGLFLPYPKKKPDSSKLELIELKWERYPCSFCPFPLFCRIKSAGQNKIPEPIMS